MLIVIQHIAMQGIGLHVYSNDTRDSAIAGIAQLVTMLHVCNTLVRLPKSMYDLACGCNKQSIVLQDPL